MKKIDKIEHIFNERFGPASVTNEGWNEPSDAIWDRIENNIDKDDRRRFGYLPFILISLLAMSGLWIANLYSENTNLQNSLQEATYELNELQALYIKSEEKELYSDVISKNVDQQIQDEEEQATLQLQTANSALKEEKVSNDVSNQKPPLDLYTQSAEISSSEENKLTSIVEENRIESENLSSSDLLFNNLERNETRSVQAVQNLGIYQSFVSSERLDLMPKQISIVRDEVEKGKRISIQPFVFMNMLRSVGSQETNLTELIDSENGSEGFGMDFLINLPIRGPFEFSTGLGFESFNFVTEYDIVLPYNPDEETVMDDDRYIDFQHSLPTAFGNTETALRLSRKRSSQNPNETAVGLDFNTQHRFEAVSVPLNLSFLPKVGNSSFGVGVSLRPTYIFSAQSGIHSVVSHHSDIDAVNNVSFSEYADLRRFNLGVGVHLSYNLDLSKRSGLTLNAGYQNFLFNFYQTENYSSSVHRLNLSAGYFYRI